MSSTSTRCKTMNSTLRAGAEVPAQLDITRRGSDSDYEFSPHLVPCTGRDIPIVARNRTQAPTSVPHNQPVLGNQLRQCVGRTIRCDRARSVGTSLSRRPLQIIQAFQTLSHQTLCVRYRDLALLSTEAEPTRESALCWTYHAIALAAHRPILETPAVVGTQYRSIRVNDIQHPKCQQLKAIGGAAPSRAVPRPIPCDWRCSSLCS